MAGHYRIVIIGGGSGGLAAATFAARLGVTVALVESNRVGGDCTWTGCVPSKALIHAAEVAQTVRHAQTVGVGAAEPLIDFERVMDTVRAARERVYAFESPEELRNRGIDVFLGSAGKFIDAHTLDVGGVRLTADRFVIATGGTPAVPAIAGLGQVSFLTFETVFEITERPDTLIVLGGGPVGSELAQAFQRLGSRVTMLEQNDRILALADEEASVLIHEQLRTEGMTLRTGAKAAQVERRGSDIAIVTEGGEVFRGDAILVAVGRQPNAGGLDLDRAGVEHGPRGIPVDDYLRTNVKHVYAVGDVTGSYQFTHYAALQGAIATRNALLPGSAKGIRTSVPWVIYTSPEIGQVGLSEHQLRQSGQAYAVHRWPIERIDRAQTENAHTGFFKFFTRPGGKLLGATVVAPRVGDVINELSVALDRGLSLSDLATVIHTYPTYGFAIQQAGSDALYDRLTNGTSGRIIRTLARWSGRFFRAS